MTPILTRAIIRGELKRIRKVGGNIDRNYLKRETGLKSDRLEPLISQYALEIIAEEAAEARAKRGD